MLCLVATLQACAGHGFDSSARFQRENVEHVLDASMWIIDGWCRIIVSIMYLLVHIA